VRGDALLLLFAVKGRVIGTWADVINRANLGMEVMHERNAHNFPLDLAAGEVAPRSRNQRLIINTQKR
ncbi:hypothetical protein FHK98_01920, partial [Cylindrospermopsis raciborskii CS-506_A]|nr:hypothetical protein [Cylindrospermopsis raciborskii CS-506_A]